MKQTLTACAAALILAVALQPAQARNNGGAIAAGVIGGIAAGAIIAGAANAEPRGPYDGPVYAPAYAVEPAPRGCFAQQEVWSPRYQAYVTRNVRVPCY
jgi:hypothetical protein